MSVLPIQNVSFTKSKMSVLQNPKCQFYITKPNLKKDTKEKDAKEKKGEKHFIHFFHQNDLFAQYRIERSPVITGDLKTYTNPFGLWLFLKSQSCIYYLFVHMAG